jgi:hypothetical protein
MSWIQDLGSGKNVFWIPDPEIKIIALDSGSVTLVFFLHIGLALCTLFLGLVLSASDVGQCCKIQV